jgi:tetratricopeptide (TPR) repeat protein
LQTVDFITDNYVDRNECFMAYLSGYKTRILKSSGQYEMALESCDLTIERYSYIEDLRIEHGDYTATIDEVDYWTEEYNEIKEIIAHENCNNQIESSEQLEDSKESDKELAFVEDQNLCNIKAEEGDPIAQHSLGVRYRYEGNYTQAIEWFQKSAAQNYAQAQYDLAQLYLDCEEVEQDFDLAFSWLQKSADLGNLAAFMDLGCMYEYGLGVEENLSKAIESFLIPANKGYDQAYYELARLYHEANNNREALIWSEKAVKSSPFDPVGIEMQATILQALGKYDEALKQFEYCLKLYKKLVDKEDYIRETEEKIEALRKLFGS